MFWSIVVGAILCLFISFALRNKELTAQAVRVLDGAFGESLEGTTPSKAAQTLPIASAGRVNKRQYLSAVTKRAVAAAQKWRCKVCGKLLDGSYEIDHIVPGGGNSVDNLQALHRFPCHMAKSAMEASKS